jgi:DNA-binding FadR family transcriptional regulator
LDKPDSKSAGRALSTAPAPGEWDSGRGLVKRLLDYVRERGLEPGERLPAERVLAEKLGIGRNALREALATLSSLRVLESRPNSGVYLRRLGVEASFETLVLLSEIGGAPTPTEVVESMEVRLALERQAITLACARRTQEDLAALDRILAETDRLLSGGGNIVDLDQDFHLALVEASHNSVLVRVLNSFYCLTHPRRRVFFADGRRGVASARSHRRIVAAVRKRDASQGVALIERHLGNARVYWREVLGPAKGRAPGRPAPGRKQSRS